MTTESAKLASLFAAAKAGSDAARQQLILANRGLAALEASRAMTRARQHSWEEGDVMGAAYQGLIEAVDGFDPARGVAFSTYACPVIKGCIQMMLRLPRKIHPRDSFESPTGIVEDDDSDNHTLADVLPSTWMNQLELLTTDPNPKDIQALAMKYLGRLEGRERDIFEHKVLKGDRAMSPEALGCNNAARVSQIRKKVVAEFRVFLAAHE